jgi:hypothetical protein
MVLSCDFSSRAGRLIPDASSFYNFLDGFEWFAVVLPICLQARGGKLKIEKEAMATPPADGQ